MRTKNTTLTPRNLSKKSRGLIRSLNRSFVRDDKSPQVVRKTAQPKEPTVCARCGAVFLHKTWRHDHNLTEELLEQRQWGFCPACVQVSLQEAQGRLIIRGSGLAKSRALIRSRIENVAGRAMATQPERRIVSIDTIDSKDEEAARGADDLAKADPSHRARAKETLRRADFLQLERRWDALRHMGTRGVQDENKEGRANPQGPLMAAKKGLAPRASEARNARSISKRAMSAASWFSEKIGMLASQSGTANSLGNVRRSINGICAAMKRDHTKLRRSRKNI